MKTPSPDAVLTSLAGNMCSTQVFLSVLCAAIASPSWSKVAIIQPNKVDRPITRPPLKQSFFDTRYERPIPPALLT